MTAKSNYITIIVCTYNRAEILKECLEALFNQTAPQSTYEVLVVDNNSPDHTKQVVQSFQQTHANLRYYLEEKQGLSHARNAGYLNTNAEWIGYMDDDGKAHTDYIEKTLEVINNHDFDCFGGRYHAWYRTPKPKWINKEFGISPILCNEIGELKDDYNAGGIIFFTKDALESINGFSTKVGMSGAKIAYGEETLVQNELRAKGKKIGYSPYIIMNHLVLEHKLKVSWHLNAAYAHGRDSVLIWENKDLQIKTHYFLYKTVKLAFINLGLIFKLKNKDYYFQNFIIDYLSAILKWIGFYKGYKKIK
ncbi:glycosyltransferase family 2 protein [Saccharicrinis sp. GN24d3]|uniref:glycosyltransferase family 2 protein n=1 Tax=Saccharicrinis sp. GN24d3 TaxID=3458416 RepID=UPI004036170A